MYCYWIPCLVRSGGLHVGCNFIHRGTDLCGIHYVATGGSAMQAVQVLLENNVPEDRITFLNLIASPEGMNAFIKQYPKIKIVCAEIDDTLDKDKYIVPGVGDFGCR